MQLPSLPLFLLISLSLPLPSSLVLAHGHPLPPSDPAAPLQRRMQHVRRGNPKYSPASLSTSSASPAAMTTPPAPLPTGAFDPVAAALASKIAAVSRQLAHLPSPAITSATTAATGTAVEWVLAPMATATEEDDGVTSSTAAASTTTRGRVNPKIDRTTSTSSSPTLARRALPFGTPCSLLQLDARSNPKHSSASPSSSPSSSDFAPISNIKALSPSPFPSPSASSPSYYDHSAMAVAQLQQNPKHAYRYPSGVKTGKWVVVTRTMEGVSPTHPGKPEATK